MNTKYIFIFMNNAYHLKILNLIRFEQEKRVGKKTNLVYGIYIAAILQEKLQAGSLAILSCIVSWRPSILL